MTARQNVRQYTVEARSTDTFGRVLLDCRDQHLVADGPVQNGCPGEAITPAELFLAGVACCGVELLEVVAREQGVGLQSARVSIRGVIDQGKPVRSDVTLFNAVAIDFILAGVTRAQAGDLVEAFKGR